MNEDQEGMPETMAGFYSYPVDCDVADAFEKRIQPIVESTYEILKVPKELQDMLIIEVGDLNHDYIECKGKDCKDGRGCRTAGFSFHNKDYTEFRIVLNAPILVEDKRLPETFIHEMIHILSFWETRSPEPGEQLEYVVHAYAKSLAEKIA